MTKIYGTGVYDFRRHRVAEYPESVDASQPHESDKGPNLSGSITLSEIQRDRLTKIAAANWAVNADSGLKKPFSEELVKDIYYSELTVKGGRKPVPLQRVMILEVSQYLENYLWPNFDPETASFEHVMSMILMVNEKFRENMAAWICFYNRKEMFKAFIERVLRLKEGRVLTVAEKTNYLLFMINAFQSLEDEIVSEKIMRLASLECWHSLSYGRFQMELCLNESLIKKWRRIAKRAKDAAKQGEPFDPTTMVEARFLRNLIEEFLEVLDSEVFPTKQRNDKNNELIDIIGMNEGDGASILYCERFMEFLIDLLSQLPTRRINVGYDHLLLHCPFSIELWYKALRELDLTWVIPRSASDLFVLDVRRAFGGRRGVFWIVIVHCILWSIWLERNDRIFEDKVESIDSVWEKIRFRVASRKKQAFSSLTITDLTRDWNLVCA